MRSKSDLVAKRISTDKPLTPQSISKTNLDSLPAQNRFTAQFFGLSRS